MEKHLRVKHVSCSKGHVSSQAKTCTRWARKKHQALEQREAGICRKASTVTETESSLGKDNSSPLLRGLLGTKKPNESIRPE